MDFNFELSPGYVEGKIHGKDTLPGHAYRTDVAGILGIRLDEYFVFPTGKCCPVSESVGEYHYVGEIEKVVIHLKEGKS